MKLRLQILQMKKKNGQFGEISEKFETEVFSSHSFQNKLSVRASMVSILTRVRKN